MASVINTNIASLNAQRNLNASQTGLNQSIQRLSSGLRINSAKDDAAGMAIATRMDSQIRGNEVAIRNSNDAISYLQVTEGGLSKATDALQRMRELAVQAANGSYGSGDRTNLNTEFTQLTSELTRLSTSTQFNGLNVFGGSGYTFQIGSGSADTLQVSAVTAASVTGSVATVSDATAAITAIDAQLDAVNTSRASLGAYQNRFDAVVSSLQVNVENISAAKSRITDADFASETAKMTRNQILQQAGTAMLAQANQLPNSVMSLLRG
ncbi:flagellin [Methylophilus glucosoxydans]|jgi:flagellin|uniref:Flagellin n=1 Tax=Methylophilus glucosoxydans TaxID=752553 RepID=A0ABW3GK67_9PROT|nr:flagellin [Methylophilus sp. VKM B-3414]MDT7850543.1 flagellin [Methylophilus sp. VKM B-3414]BEV07868.1 flagellin FliC [Methylophilus sp. DW102]